MRNVATRLGAAGVDVRVLASVVSVDGTRVSLAEGFGKKHAETEAGLVVVRTAQRANDRLARALEGAGPAVATIGDASAPRRLNHAVLDANLAIRPFDAGRLGAAAVALSGKRCHALAHPTGAARHLAVPRGEVARLGGQRRGAPSRRNQA